MKRNISKKNLKFVVLVSIVSISGIIASHAARVTCPSAAEIKHTIVTDDRGQQYHLYTGSTSGARGIGFSTVSAINNPLNFQDPATATILNIPGFGRIMQCSYAAGSGWLNTQDAGAMKDCAQQDPAHTDSFDCQ